MTKEKELSSQSCLEFDVGLCTIAHWILKQKPRPCLLIVDLEVIQGQARRISLNGP